MAVYYNENDPKTVAWLRGLICRGYIADGFVDDRSVAEVQSNDLIGFTQCHFFAGIGGWSYALRLTGWPDDQQVWTGSCPCQPFSTAGKAKGFADSRHLWPEWLRLIKECVPPVIFGEQVASKAGLGWFDVVSADLEDQDYAVGAADLCAAGVGAPHIRQRLWFVAESVCPTSERGTRSIPRAQATERCQRDTHGHLPDRSSNGCETEPLGESDGPRLAQRELGTRCVSSALGTQEGQAAEQSSHCMGYSKSSDREASVQRRRSHQNCPELGGSNRSSYWANHDLIWCRDNKWRPVESGSFPLAYGLPARMGRLRGYGNAIVPQVAAEFIQAYLEAR